MICSLPEDVEKPLTSTGRVRNKRSLNDLHFSEPSTDIWGKFYESVNIDTHVNTSRKVTENKNVFVDSVIFQNFNEEGVIRISEPNDDTKVLVSTSSFFNSLSKLDGGSIYLSSKGSCVQYKVCSYESKTTGESSQGSISEPVSGSHSYITVTNNDDHKNFVIESSITKSTGHQSVLSHSCGSILFSSINISDSELDSIAAFSSMESSSLSTTNFSNFNNISSGNIGCFAHSSITQNFYSCNVIDNKVLIIDSGLFHLIISVNLSVNQCFFKGNNASKLFHIITNPFAEKPSSGSVNECHIESDNTFQTNEEYIQDSKSMTKLNLSNLYYSYLCEVPKATKVLELTKPLRYFRIIRRR